MNKMIRLFILLLFSFSGQVLFGQNFSTINPAVPLAYSTHTVWGDYDNDGDQDMLYSGNQVGSNGPVTYLFKNNNGAFVNSNLTFRAVATGVPNVVDFGDVNNDGWLDILVCGNGKYGLYLNNQAGGFSLYTVALYDYVDTYGGFYDLNSDGRLDILLGGYVWINEGAMAFSQKTSGIPYFQFAGIDVADYDLDGYPDVAIIGNGEFDIYRNDGTGSFYRIGAGIDGLSHVNIGNGIYSVPGVRWADYDQDGDPDFLMYGYQELSGLMETHLYRNDGFGTFTWIDSNLPYIGGNNLWADINYDGYPDVVSSGLNYTLSENLTYISLSKQDGTFEYSKIENVGSESAGLSVCDFEQDGDLDFLMTGQTQSKMLRRIDADINTRPDPPGTLKWEFSGTQTHFYWEPGSDKETRPEALTYNLRIGTLANPSSIQASDANPSTGFARLTRNGNTGTYRDRYLPALTAGGTYVASIQSVDNGYRTSDWMTDQVFTLPPAAPDFSAVSDRSATGFRYNWQASYGADHYLVYASLDENFSSYLPGFGPASTTETGIRISDIPTYNTVYLRVYAVNSGGDSSPLEGKVFVTDGLAVRYDFTGSISDQGPYSTHLTQTGNARFVEDRFGNENSAIYLDGFSYLSASASALPTGERTLSAWVKMEDTTLVRTILGYGGNGNYATSQIMSWSYQNGRWGWYNSAMMAGYSTAHSLFSPAKGNPVGSWIHVAFVISQAGTKIFVNNQLVAANGDYNTDPVVTGKKLFIGVEPNYFGETPQNNPFKGVVDDIRIWSRALSDEELTTLYSEGGYDPIPGNISGFSVTKVTGSVIKASWDIPFNSSNFEFQAAKDDLFTQKLTGYESVLTTADSLVLVDLAPETDYYIRVRALGYAVTGDFTTSGVIRTTNGLAASYEFSGNNLDSGPNNSHLTQTGSTEFVTDRFGSPQSALYLNGSYSYLSGDATHLPSRGRTLSVWVKPEDSAFVRTILGYGGNTSYNSSQILSLSYQNSRYGWLSSAMMAGYSADHTLFSPAAGDLTGKWTHLVLVVDGSGTKLYINNSLTAANASFNTNVFVSGKKLFVGVEPNYSGDTPQNYPFKGAIDDIRIYDIALSGAQIAGLYEEGGYNPTPDITGLSVYRITGSSFTARWDPPSTGSQVEYQVAKDNQFLTLVAGYESSVTTGNSVKIVGLSPNGTYYFRVRSLGSTQTGNFSQSDEILTTNGLIAEYTFDGHLTDGGQFSKHLTNHGAVYTADRFGNEGFALYLNGNSYLTADGTELPDRERTYSFWTKISSTSRVNYFFSSGSNNNYSFYQNFSQWIADDQTGEILKTDIVESPESKWVHLVLMTGASGTKLYADGTLLSANARYTFSESISGKNIILGGSADATGTTIGGSYLLGSLDDFRIYDYELNETEITTLYTEGGWHGVPDAPAAQESPTVSDQSFVAAWKPSDRATGYYLDVSTDPAFGSFVDGYQNYETAATEVSVSGLTEQTRYYYRIRAFNLAGVSGYSSAISVTTTASPLSAPVVLEATSVQDTRFVANWQELPAAAGFELYVSTNPLIQALVPGYDPKSITNTGGGVTSAQVSGLNPSTTYYYWLKAVRGSETTANSSVQEVTTTSTPVIPSKPVVLEASGIDLHQFTANWQASEGATAYNVYVATDSLFNSQLTNWDPKLVTETSVTVGSLNAGRTYWYRVKAGNTAGFSGYSDSVKVQTSFSAPVSQPSSAPVNGGFTANWLAVTNAAGYYLDVSESPAFATFIDGYQNKPVSGTSHAVTGITQSGTYVYRVRAVSAFGVTSPNSETVQVSVSYSPVVAPVATAATLVAASGFRANWQAVTGATDYECQISTDQFTSWLTRTTATPGVLVTGLTSFTDYQYRVKAKIAGSWSDWSNTIDVTTTGTLAAPVLTSGNITSTGFSLNWTAVNLAQGYSLVISKNAAFTDLFDSLYTTSTSSDISGLTAGTKYWVKGYSVRGSYSGEASSPITVTTTGGTPDAPVATAATAITATSYTANWNSVPNANTYEVHNSSNDFASWTSQSVSETSAIFNSLTPGQTYKYRVRVTDLTGKTSGWSNSIPVTTLAPLSAPVLTSATALTQNGFTANWGAVSGATGYQLDLATDAAFLNKVAGFDNAQTAQTSFAIAGLNPGVLYYLRVRAYNATITSSNSTTQQITTLPEVPGVLSASEVFALGFRARWFTVSSAESYQLDVSTSSAFSSFVSGYNSKAILGGTTMERVKGLQPKTDYYYRVRSVKNTAVSGNSDFIKVTTADTTLFTAEALQAGDTSSTAFLAKWTNPGAGYTVVLDVSTNSGFTTKVSGFNEKPVTGLSETEVSGLSPVTLYYYRIKVTDDKSNSVYSNTITVKTRVAKPLVNAASQVTESSFVLSWATVSGANGYAVLLSKNDLMVPQETGFPKLVLGSPQTVSGLTKATTYYAAVLALNSDGTGDVSDVVMVTTQDISIPVPVLNAPTGITQTGFTITWGAVSGATAYRFDVAKDKDFINTVTQWLNISVTSAGATITNLTPNTAYYFRVKATASGIESDYAVSGEIKTLPQIPSVPVSLAATAIGPSTFTAGWQAVSGADSYLLDVSTESGFGSYLTGYDDKELSGTTEVLTGLQPSTTYYYRVKAKNPAGESSYSSTQQVTTTSGLAAVPVFASTTDISATAATLNWGASSGADSYRLDVSAGSGFTTFLDGYENLEVPGTSKVLTGLSSGTTYYARLRAANSYGSSSSSTPVSFLTLPAAPVANEVTGSQPTSFTASWQTVTGAGSYRLDVSTAESFSSFLTGYENLTVSGTSQGVSGLTVHTTYYFRVRAVNSSGVSANSNVVAVTLFPSVPSISTPVSNPVQPSLGSNDVTLTAQIYNLPTQVRLYYGNPAATTLTESEMSKISADQYQAVIPASAVVKEGLVYRISATNERGTAWFPGENSLVSIQVIVPSTNIVNEIIPVSSFPSGIQKETWNTLSLPFNGSVSLPAILGTQQLSNGEPVNWAAYTFSGVFNSVSTLTGGQAIFLYHKEGDGANLIKSAVENAGSITTYDINAFGNTQLANGWNLVAWPYTFGAQISVKDGSKIGSVWQMKAGSWEKNTSVKPFGGYAIYNKTGSGGVKISDVLTWTNQSLAKRSASDLAQYQADWLIRLGVSGGDFADRWNYVGVSRAAEAGYDPVDELNPVSPGQMLDLAISEQAGDRVAELAASLKPAENSLKTWTVTVKNAQPGKPVTLTWEPMDLPETETVLLVNLSAKRTLPLKEEGSVTLGSESTIRLQILAGTEAQVSGAVQGLKSDLAASFRLLPNYPNPFNPSTLISLEMGREDHLELAVFNSLGQKVKTLHSGRKEAGRHDFEWTARDDAGNPVASGVYFCVMTAGPVTKTQKMILTR